jgi:hypothetical protein
MTDVADGFFTAALQSIGKPKRKTPVQTTKLSLAHMRKQGCVAAVVERWNAHAKVKNDLFGIIDVLCLAPDGTTIGVQCTSRDHVADRVAKIGDSEHIVALRRCNWKLVVHGWDKHGARWRLREVDVS